MPIEARDRRDVENPPKTRGVDEVLSALDQEELMQKMESYGWRRFRPVPRLIAVTRKPARVLKRNHIHQTAERGAAWKLVLIELNANCRDEGALFAARFGMRRRCIAMAALMFRLRNGCLSLMPMAAATLRAGGNFLLGRSRCFGLSGGGATLVRMMPATTQQHMQG
jgi:hypothetical protein